MCYDSNYIERRTKYARRAYLGNRSEDQGIIESYIWDVQNNWRTSEIVFRPRCGDLLEIAANPAMLNEGVLRIGIERLFPFLPQPIADSAYWAWLRNLGLRMQNGLWKRGKFRKKKIPKCGKSGTRLIEIPGRESRVVSRNLTTILTPVLDPDFYNFSIGFRPKKSVAHGIVAAQQLFESGRRFMVCCDLRDAFGSVPIKRVMQIVKSRLFRSSVVTLIEELVGRDRKKGIPQGLSLSPLLLNVYLDHVLDKWWIENHPDKILIRYADDIAIFCQSYTEALAAFDDLARRIRVNGMSVKEEKSAAIFDLSKDSVSHWLGFRLHENDGKLCATIGDASWLKLDRNYAKKRYELNQIGFLTGELQLDVHANAIGFLRSKAIGIENEQLESVLRRIRLAASKYGLSIPLFGFQDGLQAFALANAQLATINRRCRIG